MVFNYFSLNQPPLLTQAKGIAAHLPEGRVEIGCILVEPDCLDYPDYPDYHDYHDYHDLDG